MELNRPSHTQHAEILLGIEGILSDTHACTLGVTQLALRLSGTTFGLLAMTRSSSR
jgi:hypothetical protein